MAMAPLFDENSDAFQDLPASLQEALGRYGETRADGDLDAVIFAVLSDLGGHVDASRLGDETNFIEDVGLDSLAIAEFVFFFEDVFRIKISNEALAEMRSLGALKRFLKSEMA